MGGDSSPWGWALPSAGGTGAGAHMPDPRVPVKYDPLPHSLHPPLQRKTILLIFLPGTRCRCQPWLLWAQRLVEWQPGGLGEALPWGSHSAGGLGKQPTGEGGMLSTGRASAMGHVHGDAEPAPSRAGPPHGEEEGEPCSGGWGVGVRMPRVPSGLAALSAPPSACWANPHPQQPLLLCLPPGSAASGTCQPCPTIPSHPPADWRRASPQPRAGIVQLIPHALSQPHCPHGTATVSRARRTEQA